MLGWLWARVGSVCDDLGCNVGSVRVHFRSMNSCLDGAGLFHGRPKSWIGNKLHQSVTFSKDMLVGVFFSGGNYNAFRRRCATFFTRSENVFSRRWWKHICFLAEARMEFWKLSFRVAETIGFGQMYVWRRRNECFSKLGRPIVYIYIYIYINIVYSFQISDSNFTATRFKWSVILYLYDF